MVYLSVPQSVFIRAQILFDHLQQLRVRVLAVAARGIIDADFVDRLDVAVVAVLGGLGPVDRLVVPEADVAIGT